MVKLLRFKLMLLMAMVLMGAGNVWADTDETISADQFGFKSNTNLEGDNATLNATNFSLTFAKNDANNVPAYNSTSKEFRLYKSPSNGKKGGSITINSKSSNTTFTKIEFTFSNLPTNYSFSSGEYDKTKSEWTGIATTSLTITNTDLSGQLKIKSMKIYYVTTSSYSITAQSNNNDFGSVSLSGSVITGSPKNGYRYATPAYTVSPANSATVAQDGNAFTVTPSANTTVTINFEAIPTHTATFSVNGETSTENYAEGAKITFPANPAAIDDKIFMGWYGSTYSHASSAPVFIDTENTTMGTEDKTFYAVFAEVAPGTSTTKTDNLTTSTFGSPSSYSDWSGKSATGGSNAVYAGNSTTYDNKAIQIRSTNPSGIVTTTSGGKAKKVTITWNSNTTTDRTLDIYGKNTAYSKPSDLYSSKASEQGKKLGSIVYGTSTELTITCDSTYIGLRSYSGAMYIDEIEIEWETGTPDTYFNYCTTVVPAAVVKPEITLGANPFLFSTTATITCETEGAAIKYSYDGENWSDYSTALTITETKTIYAKATKGSDESSVAQITATKNLAEPTVTVSGDLTLDLDGETNVSAGTLTAAVTYNDEAVEGATVTWSGNNDAVATIDASTGAVTIITTGEVTFTATYAANSDYAKATGTKTVTVINSMAPGSLKNPYTVAQARAAIDEGTGVTGVYAAGIVSEIVTAFNPSYGNISYNVSADGTTSGDQLQAFRGKSFDGADFASATDIQVGDKVVLYGNLKKYKSSTYEFDENNEVVSLKQPVTVSAANYRTFASVRAHDFTAVEGLTAYTASASEKKVSFTAVTKAVPAETGLLLKGEAATYYVPVVASADPVEGNALVGVTTSEEKPAGIFVLMNGAKGVGFYKTTNTFTLGANTAYLPASVGSRLFIGFNDDGEEATGINGVKEMKENRAIYNLRGMRVTTPSKGLYIIGAKKVVIK